MLPMSWVTSSARSIFERVEHARDVAGLRLLVVAAGRLGGEAHAAQVGHDHRVVAREIAGQRRPHVAGLAIAVQQHDRRAVAADADMDGRAVGRDFLGPECLRNGCTCATSLPLGNAMTSSTRVTSIPAWLTSRWPSRNVSY